MSRKNRNKKINQRNPPSNKGASGAPLSITRTELNVMPFSRREQDVPSWRTAHKSAESLIPDRNKLYSLYADVELDGHVEAVISKRIDPVTNAKWRFVDSEGNTVDEITDMMDTIGFEELIKHILMSKFWGYSMMEPSFYKNDDDEWEISLYKIPYLHMRPEIGVVSHNIHGDEGIDIRSGRYAKTIMEVGDPSDLGLYLKAAPYQILKRGGLGDYALFVQVFGNPIVDATWDGFDEEQRVKLLEAINLMGSGGALVRPEGTNVTLLQNNNAANGQLQDRLIKMLDRQISKTLLNTTETTESSESSGNTQAQTHAEEDNTKHESDETFVRRILNSRFRKILRAHGFDTKGGKFTVEGEEKQLTVAELKALNEMGLEIPSDFIYDRFSIPKPENDDVLKKEQPSAKPDDPKKPAPDPKKKEEEEEKKPDKKEDKTTEKEVSLLDKFLNLFSFLPLSRRGSGEHTGSLWTSPHD